jgi:hypothetical protein
MIYVKDVCRNTSRTSYEVSVIDVDFNQVWNESSDFTETTKYQTYCGSALSRPLIITCG